MEGLLGRSALAMFPLVGSFVAIVLRIVVQVSLNFLNGFVYFFAEGGFIELVLNNLVKLFSRFVGLRVVVKPDTADTTVTDQNPLLSEFIRHLVLALNGKFQRVI